MSSKDSNGWEDPAEAETPREFPVSFPDPPWIKVARLELGIHELDGVGNNSPRIQAYLSAVGMAFQPDEIPWCSAFVNWCLGRCSVLGTNRPNARSFLRWGEELHAPRVGAVTVFSRPPDPVHGHVAFYLSESPAGIRVIGGNQHNCVCVAFYPRERLLSYRWPIGFP